MFHPIWGSPRCSTGELVHIGDPAEDMGWVCTASWRFGGAKPVGGFGDYADLLAGYELAGGTPIPLERVLHRQMLGSLKWGVMCEGMYASFANGTDPSVERAMIGRRTSECEIDLMALLERADDHPPHGPRTHRLGDQVHRGARRAAAEGPRRLPLPGGRQRPGRRQAREFPAGAGRRDRCADRLRALLGRDGDFVTLNAALCDGIRDGGIDPLAPAVLAHMKASIDHQVRIDQLQYAGLKTLTA